MVSFGKVAGSISGVFSHLVLRVLILTNFEKNLAEPNFFMGSPGRVGCWIDFSDGLSYFGRTNIETPE